MLFCYEKNEAILWYNVQEMAMQNNKKIEYWRVVKNTLQKLRSNDPWQFTNIAYESSQTIV